jgi:hypothetical protein
MYEEYNIMLKIRYYVLNNAKNNNIYVLSLTRV